MRQKVKEAEYRYTPAAANCSIQVDLGAQILSLGHLNMQQPMPKKERNEICHQNDFM